MFFAHANSFFDIDLEEDLERRKTFNRFRFFRRFMKKLFALLAFAALPIFAQADIDEKDFAGEYIGSILVMEPEAPASKTIYTLVKIDKHGHGMIFLLNNQMPDEGSYNESVGKSSALIPGQQMPPPISFDLEITNGDHGLGLIRLHTVKVDPEVEQSDPMFSFIATQQKGKDSVEKLFANNIPAPYGQMPSMFLSFVLERQHT